MRALMMMTRALRLAAALALLALPLAAAADPITITVALIEAGVASGTAAALASAAAFIGANALTLGFIAINVAGAALGRRKARGAAARARAAANSRLEDRSLTLLQSTPPWRVIYGSCITGGDIVAIFTTDKTGYRENGATYTKPDALKHLVIVLAAHEVESIDEVYIDGVALGALDGSGWVTGGEFYTAGAPDSRSVYINPSSFVTVPEPVVAILHAYYTTGVGVDVTYTDVTPTLSGGNLVITNPTSNAIVVDYTIAHDSTAKAAVRVSKHLGTSTQTVDTYLNGVAPTQWTTAHRLRGLAYVVVTLDLEEPRFQGGPPPMTFAVKGKKVLDTRTSLTAWSANPALIVRDWLTSPWGYEVDAADIDVAACNAAANACDVLISLTVGAVTTPSQKTYTANGAFTTDDSREAVLDDLVESMAGSATYGATWRILAGAWTSPVMSLTDDDLDGQISIVQAGAGIDALFNGVHPRYIAAGKATPTDADPYQNATFIAADGGRELWQDVALPFTDNKARARNLARIFVERNRDGQVISYPAKLKAWPLEIGDRVTVTSAEYSFAAKTYRVTDWQFGTSAAVQLTLQEDAAAIYDLADAASADPSPNTGLPNPWSVAALTGVAATSSASTAIASEGKTLTPRVLVTWNAVTDAYVADGSGRIEILWRRPGGPWQQVTVPGDSTSVYLVGANHGDRVVIEVRARNGLDKVGPSTFVAHTVSGAAYLGMGDPGSFFEGFEASSPALDRWTNYSGAGELSLVSVSDAGSGGAVLRVGNNSGNDQAFLIHNGNIPFDPTALYRVKTRIRRTAGAGVIYVGLAGVAADGATWVNTAGANSTSSQHYVASSGAAPGSSWTEYTGYVRGVAGTGSSSACPDPSAPGVMHSNVRYIRPLVVVNASAVAGTTEVDYISVERLGGAIGTGDLGDEAATEIFVDEYDFAGASYGTATARTVTFTPAATCLIEFTAGITAEQVYPDAGHRVEWTLAVGGGSDSVIAHCSSWDSAKQFFTDFASITAAAGVTLTFKIKTTRPGGDPDIVLYTSYIRLAAIKK